VRRTAAGRTILVVVPLVLAAACGGGGSGTSNTSTRSANPTGASAGTDSPQHGRFASAVSAARLPAPIQREVAAWDGRRILLAGGLNAADTSVDGVFAFDPSTGRTTPLGTVPHAFHDAAGAMIAGKLFVFGGGAGGASTDAVQEFDPTTGRGSVVGHLPVALSDVSAATLDRVVYLVGGYDGTSPQAAIYGTVDGIHFELAGRLPRGLRYTAVAAAGGRLVVAGGVTPSGPVATVSVFDPGTAKVTAAGTLPAPVGHAAAFVLDGEVYVAGGLDAGGHAVRTVSVIDPSTGSVGRAAALPLAVSDGPAVVAGQTAWLIGGWRGVALDQVIRASVR
jgi:hypothetical protein